MKVRYQADADLNEDIVTGVRRRAPAIDFQTAREARLEGLDDSEVLAGAGREGRILVTHDRRTMPEQFGRFITSGESPGVFVVSQRADLSLVIDELILVWEASEAEEYVNSIRAIPL